MFGNTIKNGVYNPLISPKNLINRDIQAIASHKKVVMTTTEGTSTLQDSEVLNN
jgi:hypothetical protein